MNEALEHLALAATRIRDVADLNSDELVANIDDVKMYLNDIIDTIKEVEYE